MFFWLSKDRCWLEPIRSSHCSYAVNNIYIYLYSRGCCCHLAYCSQFELDWQIHPGSQFIGFGGERQICQFRQERDTKKKFPSKFCFWEFSAGERKESSSFFPPSSSSFNKGPEWQTYTTVRGWQNISFWCFTGELWNKQQAEKLNYKVKRGSLFVGPASTKTSATQCVS